jgi:hypothetical protein
VIADADGRTAIVPLLAGALGVRIRRALAPERAAAWAKGVHAARDAWHRDFGGSQFSLGRAWYTHLEQDKTDEYFRDAAASDQLVERACPGLQAEMRTLASSAVGATVAPREGWCGPGVHVFPAGDEVAERGGAIHFDTEGLTPAHVRDRAPAFTIVVMLEPPTTGGGLRVWDVLYSGSDFPREGEVERASAIAEYGAGDLVLIDSYRLHQIQPFTGTLDRVSATCHAAFVAGRWETWF